MINGSEMSMTGVTMEVSECDDNVAATDDIGEYN